jgi:hypothetical protein
MSSLLSSPSLGQTISEKLTRDIFLLWRAQVVRIIHGAQLYGYLDGTIKEPPSTIVASKHDKIEEVKNPVHATWAVQDQQILGFMNASLLREVLGQVVTYTSATQTWKALNSMFTSQSRAWTMQLRSRLSTTHKGEMTAAVYFSKMKGLTMKRRLLVSHLKMNIL